MRNPSMAQGVHWFDEQIRAHLQLDDELVPVRSRWAGSTAMFLLTLAAAAPLAIGALVIDIVRPYGALVTPPGTPHPLLFGVPALATFAMVGLAAWLVLRQDDELAVVVEPAIPPFRLIPLLGALWIATLFGLQAPLPALGVGVLLFGSVVVAMLRVSHLSRAACWLLLPALGAAVLAIGFSGVIVAFNPDAPLATLPL